MTSTSPTRTKEHTKALGGPTTEVLRILTSVLGNKAISAIVHKDVRTVNRWLKGEKINSVDDTKLRDLYQIYETLRRADDNHTIRAWFLGMNPTLDDRSPIEVLEEGKARAVMAAARAFVNGA